MTAEDGLTKPSKTRIEEDQLPTDEVALEPGDRLFQQLDTNGKLETIKALGLRKKMNNEEGQRLDARIKKLVGIFRNIT